MKIKDFTNFLEHIAPLSLQEDYDNSGLILGNYNDDVKGILVTLDCTEEIVDEAINSNCNLIVSHHPLIFQGLKKLSVNNYIQRTVIKAIKNNVAVYSMHTNLDNIILGVNSKICDRLNLVNCKILLPKKNSLRHLVFYSPLSHSLKIKEKLFSCGAGHLGAYSECSFSSEGIGSYKPLDNSNPFLGKKKQLHNQPEDRIEMLFPSNIEGKVIAALKKAHPYEEVAYQIYNIENTYHNIGSGMIGELKFPQKSADFLNDLKLKMKTNCIRYTITNKNKVSKVAVCGGSGKFLLKHAIKEKADIYISSDFKYHDFFEGENDIIIADIGHYESEQFTKELIYDLLIEKFPKFAVQISKHNTNPINYK